MIRINNLEKENSVLFVTGFSFADEHICKITQRVAKSNPTLLIIIFAFDEQSEKEISGRLESYTNIIYMPRENGNFFLETVNEHYFKKMSNELISPQKRVSEEEKENKDTKNGK